MSEARNYSAFDAVVAPRAVPKSITMKHLVDSMNVME
jgi:hypothetical protein